MALFRFLWIFFLCFSITSTEPVCSRFHYEEQTLKKMLMVEILVDKLKEEMEETVKSVNDALSELKSERDRSKQEIKQFQTSIKLDIDRERQEIEELIEELKDYVVTKDILFSARGIKNLIPSKGEALVFETTITNNGGGYDNTTGIFTVPVSGMFTLYVQLCVSDNKFIDYEITTNNRALLKGSSADEQGSHYGCHASSIPAFLTHGERVWVKTGTTSSGTILWENASENWNMFSGVLVQT